MTLTVSSFGTIKAVGDIDAGSIFVVPTSNRTAIGMMVSPKQGASRFIAWLIDPPERDQRRFDLSDVNYFLMSRALVIEDAVIVLSEEVRHVRAWETHWHPGTVLRTADANLIMLGQPPRMRPLVDLATGLIVQQPDPEGLVLAFTSWSLVRRFSEGGKLITVPYCEWELPADPVTNVGH